MKAFAERKRQPRNKLTRASTFQQPKEKEQKTMTMKKYQRLSATMPVEYIGERHHTQVEETVWKLLRNIKYNHDPNHITLRITVTTK